MDYPIPDEFYKGWPNMHMSDKKRREVSAMIEAMPPGKIERFLEREACERYLEPGLEDDVFQAFVAKCTPRAIKILRGRLEKRGSAAGIARLDKMIANLEGTREP